MCGILNMILHFTQKVKYLFEKKNIIFEWINNKKEYYYTNIMYVLIPNTDT